MGNKPKTVCSFEEKGQKQWEVRHTDSSHLTKPDCTISFTAGVNLHVVSKLQSPALVLSLGTALCRAVSQRHHLASAPSIAGPLGQGGGCTALQLSPSALTLGGACCKPLTPSALFWALYIT